MVKAKSPVNFPALVKVQPKGPSGPSNSYNSYASVASGRAGSLVGEVAPYLAMVMDPMAKDKASRYPDETIIPTGMVHLASQNTYTVPTGSSTVMTALRWKCDLDNDASAANTSPIIVAQPITTGPVLSLTDYGNPQKTWAALSSIDRTLACGIRVRVVALPPATYLPSGTLYFIQMQSMEPLATFALESACIQAVTAGKGFSVTVNELSKTDGITLPYLPQGPMSFVFSDTNAEAPVLAGGGNALPGGSLPSTVVSANGSIGVFGYGLQEAMSLRFDYAHHIEYIPLAGAAGLVQTKVEPPSSQARDAISRGAQVIQQSLAGATNASSVAGLVTGGGTAVLQSVARAAVGLIPGASQVIGVAKTAAASLGAPAWLKSALGFLA